jgi:Excreted virulence factor EspC, type VII ESX diderm
MRSVSRERAFAPTGVDVAAVYAVADQLNATVEMIDDAVAKHLTWLVFNGARAGRAHTARGNALRTALERLAAESSRWARATTEIGAALRAGADRYADADIYAAARIA